MNDSTLVFSAVRALVVYSGFMIMCLFIVAGPARVVAWMWLMAFMLWGPGSFSERLSSVRQAPRETEDLARFLEEDIKRKLSESEMAGVKRSASGLFWFLVVWIVAAIFWSL